MKADPIHAVHILLSRPCKRKKVMNAPSQALLSAMGMADSAIMITIAVTTTGTG